MAGGMSKANQRQSGRRKGYYQAQRDKTVVNKIITWARHVVNFNDTRSLDRLKQKAKIELSRAAKFAKSPRVAALLKEIS